MTCAMPKQENSKENRRMPTRMAAILAQEKRRLAIGEGGYWLPAIGCRLTQKGKLQQAISNRQLAIGCWLESSRGYRRSQGFT
jgi:hypothetical protein